MSPFEYERRDTGADESRWLLSYADTITVLMAFFALLISMSTIQRHKLDRLQSEFTGRQESDLHKLQADLERMISDAQLQGAVSTRLGDHGLDIAFTNTLLFESGKADVTTGGSQVLDRAIALFAKVGPEYHAVIEGYTDDVPINTMQFRSNWELSAGRAIQVLTRLMQAGIDRNRLSVQAFADTRPLDSEKDQALSLEERRAKNRRVVIRVY